MSVKSTEIKKMDRLVIGIPTYKRPIMLQKLIVSIVNCQIDKSLIDEITIIVVDNDIDRTAEETVNELKGRFPDGYKLNYINYPVKGLSNVRNEIFNRAVEFHPDYILCIDDDQYATSEWLSELYGTIKKVKSEIVLGPVIPVFENETRSDISYWFKYRDLQDCQRVDFFWTGNFIISTDFLLKSKIKFDDRFNFTGSEDSFFGVTALSVGAKIYGASNAIAFETIPAKRANLKWLIRRSFNKALTFTYILKLKKNYPGIFKKISVSAAYFIFGGVALVAIPFPVKWKYWGLLKISEGVGGFAGLLGIHFQEYAKDR
jgi:glycosyltransferase involved in cell wall biosynthesis